MRTGGLHQTLAIPIKTITGLIGGPSDIGAHFEGPPETLLTPTNTYDQYRLLTRDPSSTYPTAKELDNYIKLAKGLFESAFELTDDNRLEILDENAFLGLSQTLRGLLQISYNHSDIAKDISANPELFPLLYYVSDMFDENQKGALYMLSKGMVTLSNVIEWHFSRQFDLAYTFDFKTDPFKLPAFDPENYFLSAVESIAGKRKTRKEMAVFLEDLLNQVSYSTTKEISLSQMKLFEEAIRDLTNAIGDRNLSLTDYILNKFVLIYQWAVKKGNNHGIPAYVAIGRSPNLFLRSARLPDFVEMLEGLMKRFLRSPFRHLGMLIDPELESVLFGKNFGQEINSCMVAEMLRKCEKHMGKSPRNERVFRKGLASKPRFLYWSELPRAITDPTKSVNITEELTLYDFMSRFMQRIIFLPPTEYLPKELNFLDQNDMEAGIAVAMIHGAIIMDPSNGNNKTKELSYLSVLIHEAYHNFFRSIYHTPKNSNLAEERNAHLFQGQMLLGLHHAMSMQSPKPDDATLTALTELALKALLIGFSSNIGLGRNPFDMNFEVKPNMNIEISPYVFIDGFLKLLGEIAGYKVDYKKYMELFGELFGLSDSNNDRI